MAKIQGADVTDKVRIQIDVTAAHLAAMDQLMIYCGLSKRKELYDVAMSLLGWAVDEVRQGRRIAAYDRDADHVQTILLPALEAARTWSEQARTLPEAEDAQAGRSKKSNTRGVVDDSRQPDRTSRSANGNARKPAVAN